MMSNLLTRTISGAIYVALVCASLLVGQPYFFQSVLTVVAAVITFEWVRMYKADKSVRVLAVMLTSIAMICPILAEAFIAFDADSLILVCVLVALYFAFLLAAILMELCRKKNNCLINWGALFTSQLCCNLPFLIINVAMLYVDAYNDIDYFSYLILVLFIIIWANDTGAYLIGSKFGKHRLAPSVSPKKSVEGFIGGAVVAMLVGYVFLSVINFDDSVFCSWWMALLLSLLVVVTGTFGDLLESLAKRNAGVKDSGNIMPGHGGLFDRFDSFIFASIFYVPIVIIIII